MYFTQRTGVPRVFNNLPSSNKGWKNKFVKADRWDDRKPPYQMTRLGKLAFPIKRQQMQKSNFEKKLQELTPKDQTVVEIISDLCEKDSLDSANLRLKF